MLFYPVPNLNILLLSKYTSQMIQLMNKLIETLNHGPELINSSFVCISTSILLATRKKIANNIKLVKEFILEYIHLCIAKFGLVCWCSDFNQTAYDYLSLVTCYIQDIIFITKLYDHFVHHHMY